jgi:hypothetical protein
VIGVSSGARAALRRVLTAHLIVLPPVTMATLLEYVGASTAGASTANQSCGTTRNSLTMRPGVPGMGHFSLVILVKNESFASCDLGGYPLVNLLDTRGNTSGAAVDSPNGPLGGTSDAAPTAARVTLRPRQVASSLLGGTYRPVDGATNCPSYAYTVRLSGGSESRRFNGPLSDCSHEFVGPFVPGFNGTTPSGEVVGTAPACESSADSQSDPGAVMEVDARSAAGLAGSVSVFGSTPSIRRYQLILKPGRYRMTSTHQPSRNIIVKVGRVVDLGLFGGCLQRPRTSSTIPGSAGTSLTTTTTPRPVSTDHHSTVASSIRLRAYSKTAWI